MIEDTIAAIITPFGIGAVSVIRVSGNEAIFFVNQVFKGKNLEKAISHTAYYGHIVKNDKVIDEVMVTIFRAPKSFTCEDVVEVSCHGGIYSTNKVLETILNTGIRLAEKGEFSKRAFLNGRIDLTQAEAIMDIISSTNENNLEIAGLGLRGKVLNLVTKLRKKLENLMLKIEVNIDYPEYEDEVQMTNDLVQKDLYALLVEIDEILKKSQTGQLLSHGIKTAIIGRPNVGKSSILNMLLEADKAIVTPFAGTTRDSVEGDVVLDGITLKIIDTAGIRKTKNQIEAMGIEKTYETIKQADLILFVLDISQKLNPVDQNLLELTTNKPRIILFNKADLPHKLLYKDIDGILLSTLTLEGKKSLIKKIKSLLAIHDFNSEKDLYLTNIRHISLLEKAKKSLKEVCQGLNLKMEIDILAIDLKDAYDYLGEIIGAKASDELISELFANFCLGK